MIYFPFPQELSIQSYENNQNHQKASRFSDDISVKRLDLPRGFTSVVMSFGYFNACRALTKLLKIPAKHQKFKTNLNKAIADFYKEKGCEAVVRLKKEFLRSKKL